MTLSVVLTLAADDRPRRLTVNTVSGADERTGITLAEVKKIPLASPERNALFWFVAIRQNNPEGVLALSSRDDLPRMSDADLREAVATVAPALGKPVVFGVSRRSPDRAQIRLVILGYRDGDPRPATTDVLSLPMRRVNGRWVVADVRYLLDSARAVRRATG